MTSTYISSVFSNALAFGIHELGKCINAVDQQKDYNLDELMMTSSFRHLRQESQEPGEQSRLNEMMKMS